MKKYELTLSDNEKKIVTEEELEEIIEECMRFDGFLGFTYREIKDDPAPSLFPRQPKSRAYDE